VAPCLFQDCRQVEHVGTRLPPPVLASMARVERHIGLIWKRDLYLDRVRRPTFRTLNRRWLRPATHSFLLILHSDQHRRRPRVGHLTPRQVSRHTEIGDCRLRSRKRTSKDRVGTSNMRPCRTGPTVHGVSPSVLNPFQMRCLGSQGEPEQGSIVAASRVRPSRELPQGHRGRSALAL
jgi:hypothetical protein